MHGLSMLYNKEKDLSSRGEAAQRAPRLKGLFCFLKTPQTPAVLGFRPLAVPAAVSS